MATLFTNIVWNSSSLPTLEKQGNFYPTNSSIEPTTDIILPVTGNLPCFPTKSVRQIESINVIINYLKNLFAKTRKNFF